MGSINYQLSIFLGIYLEQESRPAHVSFENVRVGMTDAIAGTKFHKDTPATQVLGKEDSLKQILILARLGFEFLIQWQMAVTRGAILAR